STDATLPAHAPAGRTLTTVGTNRRQGKDDHLPGVHRKRTGGSAAPGESCARPVFRSGIRRVQAAYDLEFIERVQHPHSKTWTRFRSSGRQPSSAVSSKFASSKASESKRGTGGRPYRRAGVAQKRSIVKQNPARTFNSKISELGKGGPYGT